MRQLCSAGAALILVWVVSGVAGCSQGEAPARSWEVAAQGLYTGALSTRTDLVIAGSLNHGASLWRTPEHERLYDWSHQPGEYVELVAASFSPDGTHAITTDPRTLVLWDTTSGRALNYWGTPGAVLDAALFNDNRNALLGMVNHSALVFDAQSGAYRQTLLHEGEVGSVDVTADGTTAVTGSDDNTAVLWSLASGERLQVFHHDNPVREVAVSARGRYTFSAAQGDLVAVWDNASGRMLHQLHNGINHGVSSARFSADEQLLVVGYASRKVILYDVASGRTLKRWDPGTRHPLRASGATILKVGISTDNRAVLALSGDGRLLEFRTG